MKIELNKHGTPNMESVALFTDWLKAQGAEVLAPTNPYEIVRFRARGGAHIIYWNEKKRNFTVSGFAREVLAAYENGGGIWMGSTQKARSSMAKKKAALRNRDGDQCFYCFKTITEEEMTVEHLVAHGKGGPDHMDNLVLSCHDCNQRVNNLPLKEKIAIHCQAYIIEGGFYA